MTSNISQLNTISNKPWNNDNKLDNMTGIL